MELKSALDVAVAGSLDLPWGVLFGVMLCTGLLGGAANYYLHTQERAREFPGDLAHVPPPGSLARALVLGVVAALTVPLFLNMLSSSLMEAARVRMGDLFVFAGFCVAYVVITRRLFENAVNRLGGQIDAMRHEVRQLQSANAERDERDQERERRERERALAEERAAQEAESRPAVSYNDIEILKAIGEEQFVYGNLSGLASKTGLPREQIGVRLSILKSLALIESRINEKSVLHWYLTQRGRQLLAEVVPGTAQEAAAEVQRGEGAASQAA